MNNNLGPRLPHSAKRTYQVRKTAEQKLTASSPRLLLLVDANVFVVVCVVCEGSSVRR